MRLTFTENYRKELEQCRQEVTSLPEFDFPSAHTIPVPNPFVRKQGLALKLTYYHLMILIYRPSLPDAFSDVPSERLIMKEHVKA